jgi:hypothetical protein
MLLPAIALTFLSCNANREEGQESFCLEASGRQLSFALDSRTKNETQALFLHTDEEGREYVTFQNMGRNEILFYDVRTQALAFKIAPPVEGRNGVGIMDGYYIKNMDSIFLTVAGRNELVLIDREAVVKDVFPCYETGDGTALERTASLSFLSHPLVAVGDMLFLLPECNRFSEKNPVCAAVSLSDRSVRAFPAFPYPSFPGQDNRMKKASAENYVSRCFDGKRFAYSFYYDEDIRVAPLNHESVTKIKAKSRYISRVEIPDDYGDATLEDLCTMPRYGNMLYDPYREVYYRIAYPRTTLDEEVRPLDIMRYGGKNFSLIILDREFNVAGETLFPDYTYNSTIMFVREDGLYISESHSYNPAFSDDVLSFRCFELKKNKH